MTSKDREYREIFYEEAYQGFEQINKLLTDLEKDYGSKNVLNSLFRITHTLKGNAMGMGFDGIAGLSHVMEDVFDAARADKLKLNKIIFDCLFKTTDKLGELIEALKTEEKVAYRGAKTKLSVLLKNALQEQASNEENEQNEENQLVQDTTDKIGEEGISAGNDQAEGGQQGDVQNSLRFSDVVQIPIRKLDELLNLAGQLAIERDKLVVKYAGNGNRVTEFDGLKRLTSELQYKVMNARLVQVDTLFSKFHRIVRDVAAVEDKKVTLDLQGTDVEIDRNILKAISDSLIHIVRNAVGHGIEPASERIKKKKEEIGTITLIAGYDRDSVVIEVVDDGQGINVESIKKKAVKNKLVSKQEADKLSDDDILKYIFVSGFSNAEKITAISGRGVGMDVVKRAAESVGGHVYIKTEVDKGTTIGLRLPTSMAIKGALLFEVGEQDYAVPLAYVDAVVSISKEQVSHVGTGLMMTFEGENISVVELKSLLKLEEFSRQSLENALAIDLEALESKSLEIIIVTASDKHIGIIVDKLVQRKEIFEKKLEKPLDEVLLLSGTTILGNGKVCPVVDAAAIVELISGVAMSKAV